MKILRIIPILLLFSSARSNAQNHYVLDLKNESWNFSPSLFYISDIIDDREDKSKAGEALFNGKIQKATFKNSLSDDLKILLSPAEKDTSKIPLILSFHKFIIGETGTILHHTVSLDFDLKFYRIINGKQYEIYNSKGNPSITMQGPFSGVQEKIIRQSLQKVVENFNSWLNENADIPQLVRKVDVIFSPTPDNAASDQKDSIIWIDNYKLRWVDFKGQPGTSTFSAQSNCIFTYRLEPVIKDGVLNLKISMYACFDKTHSFVKSDQKKDTLLGHEQLHYDICELYIRYLRGKILKTSLDIIEFDPQIKTLFDNTWIEYQVEQQKYDAETNHGIIGDKQMKWQEEIGKLLKNISFDGSVLE